MVACASGSDRNTRAGPGTVDLSCEALVVGNRGGDEDEGGPEARRFSLSGARRFGPWADAIASPCAVLWYGRSRG